MFVIRAESGSKKTENLERGKIAKRDRTVAIFNHTWPFNSQTTVLIA